MGWPVAGAGEVVGMSRLVHPAEEPDGEWERIADGYRARLLADSPPEVVAMVKRRRRHRGVDELTSRRETDHG